MSRSNPQPLEEVPSRNSAAAVMQDDFAKMNEEEQAFLQSLATDLVNMLEDTERAMAKRFNDQLFDLEEGNALWSLLPAKVRTAIKRGGS